MGAPAVKQGDHVTGTDTHVQALTGCYLDDVPAQFSEFYWTLRYQDTVEGPLERIEIEPAILARIMGL